MVSPASGAGYRTGMRNLSRGGGDASPIVIAHRGASRRAPENSPRGFSLSPSARAPPWGREAAAEGRAPEGGAGPVPHRRPGPDPRGRPRKHRVEDGRRDPRFPPGDRRDAVRRGGPAFFGAEGRMSGRAGSPPRHPPRAGGRPPVGG